MKHSQWYLVSVLVTAFAASVGCGGEPPPEPATPSTTAVPVAPTETAAPTEPPPDGIAPPDSGDAANHFLADDILFGAPTEFLRGYLYAHPAKQLAPPGADGKAKLWDFYKKRELNTQHYWRSRAAKPDELAVGQLALAIELKDGQGVHRAPTSVKEAYETRWWIARIVSLRPRSEGYILVSGGYRVSPDAIRLLEGDTSPAISKQGKEDEHFVGEEHWFAAKTALPIKGHRYVSLAVPAKPDAPMSGGEGRFVLTTKGNILLTQHAWQTRKATKADLKKGQMVFVPDIKTDQTYRAPQTRLEALTRRWWAVKIDSTKDIAKGTVGVEGGYVVAVDALRVIQ